MIVRMAEALQPGEMSSVNAATTAATMKATSTASALSATATTTAPSSERHENSL